MSNARKIKVGSFTVTQPTEVTQHYECAAWYQTILAPAGVYDVVVYSELGYFNTLYVETSGPVIAAYFAPRIGAHVGKDTSGPALIGKVEQVSKHLVPYNLPAEGFEVDPAVAHITTWECHGKTLRELKLGAAKEAA